MINVDELCGLKSNHLRSIVISTGPNFSFDFLSLDHDRHQPTPQTSILSFPVGGIISCFASVSVTLTASISIGLDGGFYGVTVIRASTSNQFLGKKSDEEKLSSDPEHGNYNRDILTVTDVIATKQMYCLHRRFVRIANVVGNFPLCYCFQVFSYFGTITEDSSISDLLLHFTWDLGYSNRLKVPGYQRKSDNFDSFVFSLWFLLHTRQSMSSLDPRLFIEIYRKAPKRNVKFCLMMRNNTSGIYMISFRDISTTQSNLFKSFSRSLLLNHFTVLAGLGTFDNIMPFECARTVKTCCAAENPKHIQLRNRDVVYRKFIQWTHTFLVLI